MPCPLSSERDVQSARWRRGFAGIRPCADQRSPQDVVLAVGGFPGTQQRIEMASVTPTCFNISLGSLSLFTLFTFQEALLATVLGPSLSHDVGMCRKINRLDRAYFD